MRRILLTRRLVLFLPQGHLPSRPCFVAYTFSNGLRASFFTSLVCSLTSQPLYSHIPKGHPKYCNNPQIHRDKPCGLDRDSTHESVTRCSLLDTIQRTLRLDTIAYCPNDRFLLKWIACLTLRPSVRQNMRNTIHKRTHRATLQVRHLYPLFILRPPNRLCKSTFRTRSIEEIHFYQRRNIKEERVMGI